MGAWSPIEARGRKKHTQEHNHTTNRSEKASAKPKQSSLSRILALGSLWHVSLLGMKVYALEWISVLRGLVWGSIYSPKPPKSHWKNMHKSTLRGRTRPIRCTTGPGTVAPTLRSWLVPSKLRGHGLPATSASHCVTRWSRGSCCTREVRCTPDWASVPFLVFLESNPFTGKEIRLLNPSFGLL